MYFKSIVAASALATFFAAGAASAGTLIFSQDRNGNGLYELNTTTGAATLLGQSGVTSSTVGLAPDGSGDLLGTIWNGVAEINADGSGSSVTGSAAAEGLAFDSAAGSLYGAINGRFFEIGGDLSTTTNLAAPGRDVEGLAFGGGDTIYGLADGGDLLSYSIAGDAWSLIGNTGFDFDNSGLAFAEDLGVLFAVGAHSTLLYAIDAATAVTTAIGDTGLSSTTGGLAYLSDIAPVPVPASVMFLLSGLGGLAALRRRRAKA